MIELIFNIGGYILAVIIFVIEYRKGQKLNVKLEEADKKLDKALTKIAELGKKEEVIQPKPKSEVIAPPISRPELWYKPPPDSLQEDLYVPKPEPKPKTYDLSSGSTTTDPVIKELFEYGKRELGKAVIDSMIDSVFGEEEVYECSECGAEVDYDDIKCPKCGADLGEE